MAKIKLVKPRNQWRCQACGHIEMKWCGRCPACNEWESLVEEIDAPARAPVRAAGASIADGQAPLAISEVQQIGAADRVGSGIAELDRVLGGGLVAGSLVLLGGDPGVGKSTLLVQALAGWSRSAERVGEPAATDDPVRGRHAVTVLYATGEESVAQTAMRAKRVGACDPQLAVVAETNVETILGHARATRPAVLAVDSIQTVYTPLLDSIRDRSRRSASARAG